jgi:hypothetical protein
MNPPIDYNTALKNLQSGGLTGDALTQATASLQNAYKPIPQAPVSPSINAGEIGQTTPMKLPKAQTPIAAVGLNEHITSLATSEQKTQDMQDKVDQSVQTAGAGKANALTAFVDSLKNRMGKTALTDQAYRADTGLGYTADQAKNEVKEINNKIFAADEQTRKQIEAIQANNPTGQLEGGQQIEIQRIQRQAASYKADLYVEQLAKQGRYDSAKEIADRSVAMQLEEDQNKYEASKYGYEENRDQYNKAEQRQYEFNLKQYETYIKNKEDELTGAKDLALEAQREGAPTAIVQKMLKAQTREEAIGIGGQYVGALERQKAALDLENKRLQNNKLRIENNANGKPTVIGDPKKAQALSVILGSGKFTKEQTAQITNAINNGEDPFTVVKNQAKNIMGQTEATTVTKYESAKSSLQDIQNSLSQFYANGGKTNLLNGNYEKVINKLGQVSDPKLVDLAVQIQAQLQVYRNAVSGTAYSVQEGKDINSIFPGINKSEGLNTSIINGRVKAFDSSIDGAYKSTLGSAYEQFKTSQTQSKNGASGSWEGNTAPANTTTMTGPQGVFHVPNDQVELFKKNGYK